MKEFGTKLGIAKSIWRFKSDTTEGLSSNLLPRMVENVNAVGSAGLNFYKSTTLTVEEGTTEHK